jgi:murein DD-endopeptidase MepM/ murein hydrolase activator NlpD
MSNSIPQHQSLFGRAPGLSTEADLSDLGDLKADGGRNPEAIKAAAKQFESIFLHQVFKSMRATIPKDGMTGGGFGGEVFTDMLDQQYASIAANSSSFGLAQTIARQLGAEDAESSFQLKESQGLRRLGVSQAYQKQATPMKWDMPVEGDLVRTFGPNRSPNMNVAQIHRGVDWNAPEGTSIKAARSGTVTYAGQMGHNGQTVVVDHGNGIESLYAHAKNVSVSVGEKVVAGGEIATVGKTGNANQSHLHFEVRQNGRSVDPTSLLGLKKK